MAVNIHILQLYEVCADSSYANGSIHFRYAFVA